MSTVEKKIGKISSVTLGNGGYQDAEFGLSLVFESNKGGWGTGTFISGGWYPGDIDPHSDSSWVERDRRKTMAHLAYEIARILREAKVREIGKLKGIPVEVTFEKNAFKEWRILEEAL